MIWHVYYGYDHHSTRLLPPHRERKKRKKMEAGKTKSNFPNNSIAILLSMIYIVQLYEYTFTHGSILLAAAASHKE